MDELPFDLLGIGFGRLFSQAAANPNPGCVINEFNMSRSRRRLMSSADDGNDGGGGGALEKNGKPGV